MTKCVSFIDQIFICLTTKLLISNYCHCEERSDEASFTYVQSASLRSQ
jgi:hypothetical protein